MDMANHVQLLQDHNDVLQIMGLEMFRDFDETKVFANHHQHLSLHSSKYGFTFNGLKLIAPEDVYTPFSSNSSTHFMARVISEQDIGYPPSIIEIGTGTGGVILSLAKFFGPSGRYLATDICPKAVEAAAFNAKINQLDVPIIQSDLFENVDDISYKTILFNIPLINRTPNNDTEKYMLCDPNGEIMERFLAQLIARGIKDQSVFLHISNIGCLAPLKPFTKQIFIREMERFTHGNGTYDY